MTFPFPVQLMNNNAKKLIDAITDAGLTTNLKLCLDAGDANSWLDNTTNVNRWKDVSGGGYDFIRGATDSFQTDDPTFVGTVGDLSSSTYWSFDGGDFFMYDSAQETWMDSLHKDGAIFTFFSIYRLTSSGRTTCMLFSDYDTSGTPTGATLQLNIGGQLTLDIAGGGSTKFQKTSDALSLDAWHAVGMSLNENGGASAGFFWKEGAYLQSSGSDTWNPAYTSPSSSGANAALRIGADAVNSFKMKNGDRIACFAMWQGTALTKAQLDSIFEGVRGRFDL